MSEELFDGRKQVESYATYGLPAELAPVMDEEDVAWEERWARELLLVQTFKRGMRICMLHPKPDRALMYFMLALGWYSELPGEVKSAEELASKLGQTRANATKYTKLFQDVIPPGLKRMDGLPGQRSQAAREVFRQTRNGKLGK